ncbi:MAG: DUF1320 family protein [Deltaproteobacteria bacterium]|nr:DUF1320 family protein [Deltaproteobacteria bacterium]
MNTTFLVKTDYSAKIDSLLLEQITGGSDTILDLTEADAACEITDKLGARYKVDDELAKTGDGRNRTLVRWMLNLSVYYLYGRVADMDIPERVVKDYDDTLAELEKIAMGKLSCGIERITDSTTGAVITKLRMGSNAQRSHNPY